MMISIVIPAFNEQSGVADTIRACREALDRLALKDAEIIVVDDGSTDGTGDAARSAGATVIRHPCTMGYGRSLKDGIRAARHDSIAILDGDGTYPADQIPTLLQEKQKGFNMVVGARQGHAYHSSYAKRWLRKLLKFLVEFTAGGPIPDINSGMRVFSRKEILAYFDYLCDTFSFSTSLTLAYMLTGKSVAYVSIPYSKRVASSTKVHLLRDSLRTMQFIVEAILYFNPIKMFIVFSAVLGLGAVLCLAGGALARSVFAMLAGVGMFLTSCLVFALGMLAVVEKQILRSQDRRLWADLGSAPNGEEKPR